MNYAERCPCGTLDLKDDGRQALLTGWVDALRDHGEVLFIHLRDRSGILQVVFSPEEADPAVCREASTLKPEDCIMVSGVIRERASGTENPLLKTGRIEVMATALTILSKSAPLPFSISEKAMIAGAAAAGSESVNEELRLQYRYLDLRRPTMLDHLVKRHRIVKVVRDFLDERDFIEVETPMLTRSTPEGARDYIVPSRVHPGNFYALPQSPQLFKQLLMVSGCERYFQIVRCFRDEDLRPNRQPEFTQLDLEASFIDEEFIYTLIEELLVKSFAVGGIELPRPFPRIRYDEAIDTMGSDRPDTRFGLRFVEATDLFPETSYSIFRQILQRGGCIKGITVKGQSEKLSKNLLQNEYAKEIVPGFGAKGMTWMRVVEGGLDSNIVQFFSPEEQRAVIDRFDAEPGDVILMIADPSYEIVTSALGQLRLHLAGRLGLIPDGAFSPLWVTDFPLFIATDDGVTSSHHPFTAPDRTDFDPADRDDLLSLRSRAYDVVVNGEELGGGSIRIHDRRVQQKIFSALGLTPEQAEEKFGFFLRALEFAAPPHGGLALGMDRVVSMILKAASIREVIAFPKNRSAFCPLTEAPSPVAESQLAELGLPGAEAGKALPGADKQQDRLDHLSWVSRIGFEPAERPSLATAVAEAEELARRIAEIPGREPPLFSVVATCRSEWRKAVPRTSALSRSGEVFKNAPAVKGDYFKVAGILE